MAEPIDPLDLLAEQCRRDLDDMPYYEGTLRRDACIRRYLGQAADAERERRPVALPRDFPADQLRLDRMREMVANGIGSVGGSPLPSGLALQKDLLGCLEWCLAVVGQLETMVADALDDSRAARLARHDGVTSVLDVIAEYRAVVQSLLESRLSGDKLKFAMEEVALALDVLIGRIGESSVSDGARTPHEQTVADNRRMKAALLAIARSPKWGGSQAADDPNDPSVVALKALEGVNPS